MVNDIFERLFNYFSVSTIRELSDKINMSESTVSKWRQRESINSIKKKCRELGIYNEIFNENVNFHNSNNSISGQSSLIDLSDNKSISLLDSNVNNNIPPSILIEINSLFERIKNRDKDFIKEVTYKIEDFISDLKKTIRD